MTNASKYHNAVGERDLLRLTICNELYNAVSQQFMIDSGLKPGMTVLELGCGTGHMALWLAQYVGQQGKVIAIDNSQAQLDIAKGIAEEHGVHNIEFVLHDAYDLASLDIQCDFVYARWILFYLRHPQSILRTLYDKLDISGVIAIETSGENNGVFSCPPNEAIDGFQAMFHCAVKNIDKDPSTAFQIYPWLRGLGAMDLRIKTHQPMCITEREKSVFRLSLESAKETILTNGADENTLALLIEKCKVLEENDQAVFGFFRNLLMSGRKAESVGHG